MRQREPRRSVRVDEVPEDHRTTVMSGFLASTHTVRLSHQMLMMASLLSPGQASFGKLWEWMVATLTLRRAAAAAATAATSYCSVLGNVALAARQMVRSGKEPYVLVTVQSDVPRAQDTGSGGGLPPASCWVVSSRTGRSTKKRGPRIARGPRMAAMSAS